MIEIALGASLLALFWAVAYLWSRQVLASGGDGHPGILDRAAEQASQTLDQMFHQVSPARIRLAMLACALFGAALGFLAPGAAQVLEVRALERAVALNRAGNHEAALSELGGFKSQPSALAANERGVAHLALGDLEAAEKDFRQAVELVPGYAKAQANLGRVYEAMGDPERARFQQSRAAAADRTRISEAAVLGISDGFGRNLGLRTLLALGLGAGFFHLPGLAVAFLRRRRVKAYDEQLPDGLVMAANGLRAGFSLLQALQMVAEQAPAPLSQEFGLLLKEHQMGADLDQALTRLATRMPTQDTRIFVNSLLILRETGGNLTEIFDTLADTIRERKRVQQKIKTMTAEGETQAWFLAALPPVLLLILNQLNPEGVGLFFTTFGGWMLLLLMALMEVLGLFLMLQAVKVKV